MDDENSSLKQKPDDETSSPSQDPETDIYSMPELLGLADSTMEELGRFRREVLKNYYTALRNKQNWVTGFMASKTLCVTDRTLRRYRIKYNIRTKMINGICRYYYPDLLALLQDPSTNTDEKKEKTHDNSPKKQTNNCERTE